MTAHVARNRIFHQWLRSQNSSESKAIDEKCDFAGGDAINILALISPPVMCAQLYLRSVK